MATHRLFISHAGSDEPSASAIVAHLEAAGVRCWISTRDIPPEAVYADAIAEGMRASSACLVVLTDSASNSVGVKREAELASRYGKPIIPLRIGGAEPGPGLDYYLNNLQKIDGSDLTGALDKIAAHLAGAPRPLHASKPPRRQLSAAATWGLSVLFALLLIVIFAAFNNREGSRLAALLNSGGPSQQAPTGQAPSTDHQELDRGGCPPNSDLRAHTILLVDTAGGDALAQTAAAIDSAVRRVPAEGRISVFKPAQTFPWDPQREFTRCSPGRAAEANPLLENPRAVEQRFEERVAQPLIASVRRIAALDSSGVVWSPILESLRSLSTEPDFAPSVGIRRLIVVSDMVQNSPNLSFRSGSDLWTSFQGSALASDIPDLRGVVIEVSLVPGGSDFSRSEIMEFWQRYAAEAGASVEFVS